MGVKALTSPLFTISFSSMDERFPVVKVGEESLSYKRTGRGEPLFCLHGWAGYERTYDGILPWFNKHFEVFQIAWPGSGSAPLGSTRYRIGDMIAWVDSLRRQLGFERIHLMGNCIGANVALEYAYVHPERVKTLVINEPHAYVPRYFHLLLNPLTGWALMRLVFKTRLGIKLLLKVFPLEDKNGSGYTERRLQAIPVRGMYGYLRAMYLYSRETNLYTRPPLQAPTILPIPEKTFGQVKAFEERYSRCFRDLKVVKVPGPVHNPVVENPEAFSKAVLSALGIMRLTNR